MDGKKIGGCLKKILKNFRYEKKNLAENEAKSWKIDFRLLLCNKFYFFVSNLNSVCSQLSFDVHIAYIGEGQIFTYDFFRGQTRWLRRPLTGKVWNMGLVSKSPHVDKDPIYHLRPCLVDLSDKWQCYRSKTKMGASHPPPPFRSMKYSTFLRVKIDLIAICCCLNN